MRRINAQTALSALTELNGQLCKAGGEYDAGMALINMLFGMFGDKYTENLLLLYDINPGKAKRRMKRLLRRLLRLAFKQRRKQDRQGVRRYL